MVHGASRVAYYVIVQSNCLRTPSSDLHCRMPHPIRCDVYKAVSGSGIVIESRDHSEDSIQSDLWTGSAIVW